MTTYPSSRNPGFTPRRPFLSLLAAGMALATLVTTTVSPARGQGAPGSLDTGFAPYLGDYPFVDIIKVRPDGRLIIGGQFTGVARFDDDDVYIVLAGLTGEGRLDRSFHLPFGKRTIVSDVSLLPDGKLFVAADRRSPMLTRHYPDGSEDPGFSVNADFDNFGASLPLPDGRLLVLGNYYDSSYRTHSFIERLYADGTVDRSFQRQENTAGLGPAVLQPDGKVVVNGSGLLFRFNTDGSIDGAYRTSTFSGSSFNVEAMLLQPDGKVLVGGAFTNVNGFATAGVARLNADGSVDTGFRVTADATLRVSALALQADGKVLAGGYFTRIGGVPRGRLARLNADGSVDPSFATGAGADDSVVAITLQSDNKVLIGGGFQSYDGVPQGGLARLNNTVALPVNAGTFSVVGTPTRGGFVISRAGNTDAAVTVVYHNGGSASRGVDYVTFPGTLQFAVGQKEAVIPVTLLPGANRNKKVKVFLDPAPNGEYQIGKAQTKVFLSDL